MFDLIERFRDFVLGEKRSVLYYVLRIVLLAVVLFIGIMIGGRGKDSGYQETIRVLQSELNEARSQKESYVSVSNEKSLIMILVDDDYRFLTTSEFKTISQSLPEMRARKFILVDLTTNKKIIELESLKLSNIYQEIGKMEAQTDPNYYIKNISIFPELAEKKSSAEKEYQELYQRVQSGTISDEEKSRKEMEITTKIKELNMEYPVNGYQWTISNGVVTLKESA